MAPISSLSPTDRVTFDRRDSRTAGRCGGAWTGRLVLALALLAVRAPVARADAPTANAPGAAPGITRANPLGDDELLLDEVFESHLPTTLKKYDFRLSVNPHLGDLRDKDNLRLTTVIRYGLTETCEITAASNLYFTHGLNDGRAFDHYGAASFRPGIKVNLGQILITGWETAAGAEYEFPTGHPVPELTDGLRHLRPYTTFSHRLSSHPDLRIFVGLRIDAVTKTSLPGEFGKNAFHESSTGVTGGWVLDRGNLHYTMEASFDTTRLITRTEEDVYSVRPGIIWEIPTRRNPEVMSHWTVGAAINETFGPGGNSLGGSFMLRYNRDLKDRKSRRPVVMAP